MGSNLKPILANVFMCHFKIIWLKNCLSSFKSIVYRRSVVHKILLFQSKDHVTLGGELGTTCTNISSFYDFKCL